ncbi:unnamed protein product [Cylicostephanus goldi]|uniref:Uncharacterized protein n=1 Tax=Cylicostephanus goldi TaxID=71465 RepID=A0A3P7NN78_CYLGO|nr:unnamed protein product [Cylicostephanus goldi]
MVVTGSRPNRELQPGMYFVREGTHEIRGYVPINEVGESNLEKLGWMRFSEGRWDIRNGNVKIKQAHVSFFRKCNKYIEILPCSILRRKWSSESSDA